MSPPRNSPDRVLSRKYFSHAEKRYSEHSGAQIGVILITPRNARFIRVGQSETVRGPNSLVMMKEIVQRVRGLLGAAAAVGALTGLLAAAAALGVAQVV